MTTEHAKSNWRRTRRLLAAVKWTVVVGLVGLGLLSLTRYADDSQWIDETAHKIVGDETLPSARVRKLVDFTTHEIPRGKVEDYFLIPAFAPLKPTARQVIEGSGDCAYKSRAFIVMAHQLGIDASKLCLHDATGEPRHAVVRARTERGDYIVDVLYGICYQHDDGTPMSIEEIDARLSTVIDHEVARGNMLAKKYPLERYPFHDVSTINWQKNDSWKFARRMLAAVMSDERIDRLQRPYFAEEPALMVAYASFGIAAVIVVVPAAFRWVWRRRHSPENVESPPVAGDDAPPAADESRTEKIS